MVCATSQLCWVVGIRRRKFGRTSAAQRARRLMGQGLGHMVARPQAVDYKPAPSVHRSDLWHSRRSSPTYDTYRQARPPHLRPALQPPLEALTRCCAMYNMVNCSWREVAQNKCMRSEAALPLHCGCS